MLEIFIVSIRKLKRNNDDNIVCYKLDETNFKNNSTIRKSTFQRVRWLNKSILSGPRIYLEMLDF